MDTTTIDQIADAVVRRIGGALPVTRYRRVECDWLELAPGSEPIWAEVCCSLSFAAIEAIPIADCSYNEFWAAIAPYVRAWNLVQETVVDGKPTGEYAPVPPPMVGGPEVFKFVDPVIGDWLALAIKRILFGGPDRPKESTPPSSTAAGSNAPVAASSARARNRNGRKGSTAS